MLGKLDLIEHRYSWAKPRNYSKRSPFTNRASTNGGSTKRSPQPSTYSHHIAPMSSSEPNCVTDVESLINHRVKKKPRGRQLRSNNVSYNLFNFIFYVKFILLWSMLDQVLLVVLADRSTDSVVSQIRLDYLEVWKDLSLI